MNPTAIYSKSGKGVQEAAGKTSLLTRPDRAVLSAIDGRATLAEVAQKVGKTFDLAFQTLVAQLDKNGFVREVSPGGAAAAPKPAAVPPRPAAAPPKPAAPKPAAKPAEDSGSDLDFSSLGTPSRPAAPPPPPKEQQSALNKAREDAEAKAQGDRDRLKKEVEAKTRAEMEAKLRAEAEAKAKSDAAAAADAKIKAARDAALKAMEAKVKAEQEAKARLEAERRAREDSERRLEAEKNEAERARKETEEKARREAEELRKSLEEERKAREAAERKAKEEAERVRKELEEERKRLEAERKREDEERAERRKREDEEEKARRKQKEEEERKAEEERAAMRKQREEEEATRELEEQATREAERAAKKKQREEQEAAREAQEEAEREAARAAKRKLREEEEAAAAAAAAVVAAAKPAPKAAPKSEPPKAEGKKDSFADSLLADLDSFTNKDEDDAKARDEAERKAKAEAERQARAEAERQAKEDAEQRRREEEESRRKEEEARRAREEEQRHAQEEERRRREAEEIQRKAEAATAAAMAKEGKKVAPKAAEDDIPVTEDDLDMDEVNREKAQVTKGQPKEKEPKPEKKKKPVAPEPPPKIRRPIRLGKLGKPIALTLGLVLVVAIGVAHVVPLDTADYERVATEALGRPVKIGSAKLWLLTGLQLRFADVRVGDARIAHVTGYPSLGSVFGDNKEFSKIELDGFSLPQEGIGDALFASVKSEGFTVEHIVVKSLEVPGPATLPKSLQADIALNAQGAMKTVTVRGPDALVAKITPQADGVIFELTAAGFTLPIAPQVTLSNFGMKGNATPRGMTITDWGGSLLGGAMTGNANVRWGSSWVVEGVVTVRNINAAVFAPALLSSGSGEGTARFSMNAPDPKGLVSAGRLDGNFTISKGTLGSIDLARAIQSGGKAYAGSTQFVEMNGQGTYDRGAVSLRNVTISAGALNAGASADISQSGALSGRIVADVKTTNRALSATLLLGGTVKEPQVRN